MPRTMGIAVVILLLAAAGLLLLTRAPGEQPSPHEPERGEQVQSNQGTREGERRVIEVTAVDNRFQPDTIKVTPGETLVFKIVNKGSRLHTFTIDELGVDVQLSPGEEAEVEVTIPPNLSEVTFYCRPHRPLGMEGTLTVA